MKACLLAAALAVGGARREQLAELSGVGPGGQGVQDRKCVHALLHVDPVELPNIPRAHPVRVQRRDQLGGLIHEYLVAA